MRESLEAMEDSAGSSDAEMSKIEQSLTYKLNALSQTWVGTWQGLLDRGDIGAVIDLLTSLSEGIGWVIDNLGLLKTAVLGIAGYAGFKNVGVA